MDAYGFWKRIDEKNPFPTLIRLVEECGIDYRRVKKNRSDSRLPNIEDAYLLASHTGASIEYLLTGKEERIISIADEVYEYMQTEMPSLLEDIMRKISLKKEAGFSGNRA